MQQIGFVIVLIGMFVPVVGVFAHEVWGLIYCYLKGEDWKYHLYNLFGMLWIVLLALGLALIMLGTTTG